MRKILALCTALLLSAGFANRLQADAADDARGIVQRAFDAHGGLDKLARLKSFVRSAKGEFTTFGGTVPATFETSVNLPGQFRWSLELDTGNNQKVAGHLVVNGDKGWQSGTGALKEMTKQQFEEQRDEGRLLNVTALLPLREPAFALTTIPEIKVANEPAAGVKAACKGQPDIKLYFDKKTGLLVKAERKGKEAGLDITKEYFYSEHKVFDGIMLPTKQLEVKNGKTDAEWNISGYKLGKVDDAVFTKP